MSSVTNQSEAFEACRLWVEQATATITDRMRQPVADAARPQKPYNVVEWPTDVAVGGTPHERVGDPIVPDPGDYDHTMHRYQRRQGTFRVEAFGAGAYDRLIDLRMSLRDVLNKQYLKSRGIALQVIGGPVDTTRSRDTTWEESAIVDFTCLYVHETSNPVAIIETVTVNAKIKAYPDSPDGSYPPDPDPLEVTITVP